MRAWLVRNNNPPVPHITSYFPNLITNMPTLVNFSLGEVILVKWTLGDELGGFHFTYTTQ